MKPKAHLIHGFNVADGGKRSLVRPVAPVVAETGHWDPQSFSWGWTWLFRLAMRTHTAARKLAPRLNHGDLLVTHSHGFNVAMLALAIRPRRVQVLAYNPAARRDVVLPPCVARCVVLYSPDDKALAWGRLWRQVASLNPFREHPWGRLGKLGPLDQPQMRGMPLPKGTGHAGPNHMPTALLKALDRGYLLPPGEVFVP